MDILTRKFEKEKTIRSYKRIAWFYDLWSLLTESKAAKHVLQFAEIRDGDAVLEIACGTGLVFKEIVKRNPNGKNIGIDLSPDMLAKAKNRLKNSGLSTYSLQEGNALDLNFEDNSFDIVINNFMIDLMPEDRFDQLAEEFYRVIKPGGKILISNFSFGKKRINKFWLWVAKYLPGMLTGCRPVSFENPLIRAGFKLEKCIEISQNSFPSEIIRARK